MARQILVPVLLCCLVAAPAAAERPANPQVTDPCGPATVEPVNADFIPPASSAVTGDICAAWFTAQYADNGGLQHVTATIELSDVPAHDLRRYQLSWERENCSQSLAVQSEGDGTQQYLYESCDGVGRTIALPSGAVTADGSTLTVTMPADTLLTQPFVKGAVLTRPSASFHVVKTRESTGERVINVTTDVTAEGSDFTI